MKKFLVLAAVLAVSSANAEELKFGDLNYFLKAGQFNAGANFIVNNETTREGEAVETEVDNYALNTHFGLALTNQFNLTFGWDLLIDGETQADGENSADAWGLQNPRLGANFRLLDQESSGFNFDIGTIATFNFTDREVASRETDGNMINPLYSNFADPRHGLELNARLGKKWDEANEFYLLAGAVYHLEGDYDQKDGDKVEIDPSLDFKAGAFYQYRPVNEFMITLGVNAVRFGERDLEVGALEATDQDHLDFQFLFAAKYLVTESTVFNITFTKDRKGNYDREIKGVGDNEIDKRNGILYGCGVDFLF